MASWKKVVVESSADTIAQSTSANAATVTTNADLTGNITSDGNATTYAASVPIGKGGTEQTTTATGDLLYADAVGSWARLAVGADDLVLTLDGGEPVWASASQGDITSVVAGSGMTGGATDGAATLNVVGGTGIKANADSLDVDLTELADQTAQVDSTDELIMLNGGTVQGRKRFAEINLGQFVNDQSWVTTSGVTSVGATAPVASTGGATPTISMAAATTSVAGHLKAADWTTFNAKAPIASPTFTGTIAIPNYADVESTLDNIQANQNAFTTVNPSTGDDVVADSTTDTLNFTASGGMTITGTAGTDTINFSSTDNNTDTLWTGVSTNLVAATGRTSLGLGNVSTKNGGIGSTDILQSNGAIADDDFLRIDGTAVEGRSGDEVLSDLGLDADLKTLTITASATLQGSNTGDTSISDAIDSTSSTVRASSTAVKAAYDHYSANTDVDVSVANLKTALAGGFAGNAVTIGDSDDVVTIGNDLTVTGDLLVSGDTVTVNVGTLSVEDKNIQLANGSTSAAASSEAGITVRTTSSTQAALVWKNGGNLGEWLLQRNGDGTALPIQVCQVEVTSGTPSGLDTIAGTMAYNSADNDMWLYI